MSDWLDSAPLPEGLGISAEEWHQTPLRVRLVTLTLFKRLEALAARLHQDSSHASRPPSADSPATKRQRRMQAITQRTPGAQPGHPGHQQVLMEPTSIVPLWPDACSCGQIGLAELTLYHTVSGDVQ